MQNSHVPVGHDLARGRIGVRFAMVVLLFLLVAVALGPPRALGGDSLYGKVTEVKSAEVVVLDYGEGKYNVRITGIQAPREKDLADRAKEMVSRLVLDKNARLRFEGRNKAGEMVGQLQTDDPDGIKDVGLELVRSGMARRTPSYDYKYHELSAAEKEARGAKRGLWANAPAEPAGGEKPAPRPKPTAKPTH
jgi:endonuclease YncB( thermonuclease family)